MPTPAAILCIGTELTRGELVDTNGAWLAARLTELGFEVLEKCVVDDDDARIGAALSRLALVARVIVCTGGLGPTTDDLTTAAVARVLGVSLVRDEASIEHIRRRFERLGREMSPTNAKQADFPEGARILPNREGTAPGFSVALGAARAFFMPGVPREMKAMFEAEIVQAILPLAARDAAQVRLKTFGLPESVVGERLAGVEASFPGVTLGYRAHFPEIEVKVHARAEDEARARSLMEAAAEVVRARLGATVYGEGEDSFARAVSRALAGRAFTLALAESCTGGLVGHMLTREAGASAFLLADAVTYSNAAKTALLGVSEETLRAHGAVSREVATEMAEGARRVTGSTLALSITGIAGPDGGTTEKPVGLVFVALAREGGTDVREHRFTGDRARVQTLATYHALSMILEACAR